MSRTDFYFLCENSYPYEPVNDEQVQNWRTYQAYIRFLLSSNLSGNDVDFTKYLIIENLLQNDFISISGVLTDSFPFPELEPFYMVFENDFLYCSSDIAARWNCDQGDEEFKTEFTEYLNEDNWHDINWYVSKNGAFYHNASQHNPLYQQLSHRLVMPGSFFATVFMLPREERHAHVATLVMSEAASMLKAPFSQMDDAKEIREQIKQWGGQAILIGATAIVNDDSRNSASPSWYVVNELKRSIDAYIKSNYTDVSLYPFSDERDDPYTHWNTYSLLSHERVTELTKNMGTDESIWLDDKFDQFGIMSLDLHT